MKAWVISDLHASPWISYVHGQLSFQRRISASLLVTLQITS